MCFIYALVFCLLKICGRLYKIFLEFYVLYIQTVNLSYEWFVIIVKCANILVIWYKADVCLKK